VKRGRQQQQQGIDWGERSPRQNFMSGGGCGCGCLGGILFVMGIGTIASVPAGVWFTLSNIPYYIGFATTSMACVMMVVGTGMYILSFFTGGE
jgi:hypothetical protein